MCRSCGSGGGLRRPFFRKGSANPQGKLKSPALKSAGQRRGRARASSTASKVNALSPEQKLRVTALLKRLQHMLAK